VYRNPTISDPDYSSQFLRNGGLLSRQRVFVAPENLVTESAGINRHIVGDGRALRKRRSDSILASSRACDLAREGLNMSTAYPVDIFRCSEKHG
jgi:hypothetical protein